MSTDESCSSGDRPPVREAATSAPLRRSEALATATSLLRHQVAHPKVATSLFTIDEREAVLDALDERDRLLCRVEELTTALQVIGQLTDQSDMNPFTDSACGTCGTVECVAGDALAADNSHSSSTKDGKEATSEEHEAFGYVPESVEACWRGAWDDYDEADRKEQLENIAAAIDYCFNPPDDDADQGSILVDALLGAAAYVAAQPCTCTEDACPRCVALGRFQDKPCER